MADDPASTRPISYTVHDPLELGLDPIRVPALLDRARREVDDGLLPSCQVALARHGRLALFETLGDAEPGSRYVMFSCTKGFVGGAVWLLVGRGLLTFDTVVAEVIPEFATNGKDVITVSQLLTHTSGFPAAPLSPERAATREGRLEQFSRWRLNWEPGSQFEYHPTSAHWVLAELIERVSGTDYRSFVVDEVARPLGLDRFELGAPGAASGTDPFPDINRVVNVGEVPTPAEIKEVLGFEIDLADYLGEVTQDALLLFARPEVLAIGFPGAGGVATAADLALYYQGVSHDLAAADGDAWLWEPRVLRQAVEPINDFPDPMLGTPAHRSLGLQVAGDPPDATRRGFGHGLSPASFGHDGAGGQLAWVDPESGISLGYLTNGLDAHVLRQARRNIGISSRAAVCLADD